jgi:LysM repeat protein
VSFVIHVLQPGESLISLADRYGAAAAAIIAANGLNAHPLWEGSYVVIPLGNPDPATLPQFAVHQVPAGGEVLTVVAESYGADSQAIRAYNHLGPSDELPEERWLIIPLP